jgi:hypothetical protein
VVELLGPEAGLREAPRSCKRREAGHVLDAVEALLLRRADKLTVDDEGRGSVTVVGVQSENRRHGRLMLVTASRSERIDTCRDGRSSASTRWPSASA